MDPEQWIQVEYPELFDLWKDSYLSPERKDIKTGDECLICNIRSNSGLHYGVFSCEADKQFLKRTFHEKNVYQKCFLKCPPRSRGWCQYCRLRAGLMAGINLKMIRIYQSNKRSPPTCSAPVQAKKIKRQSDEKDDIKILSQTNTNVEDRRKLKKPSGHDFQSKQDLIKQEYTQSMKVNEDSSRPGAGSSGRTSPPADNMFHRDWKHGTLSQGLFPYDVGREYMNYMKMYSPHYNYHNQLPWTGQHWPGIPPSVYPTSTSDYRYNLVPTPLCSPPDSISSGPESSQTSIKSDHTDPHAADHVTYKHRTADDRPLNPVPGPAPSLRTPEGRIHADNQFGNVQQSNGFRNLRESSLYMKSKMMYYDQVRNDYNSPVLPVPAARTRQSNEDLVYPGHHNFTGLLDDDRTRSGNIENSRMALRRESLPTLNEGRQFCGGEVKSEVEVKVEDRRMNDPSSSILSATRISDAAQLHHHSQVQAYTPSHLSHLPYLPHIPHLPHLPLPSPPYSSSDSHSEKSFTHLEIKEQAFRLQTEPLDLSSSSGGSSRPSSRCSPHPYSPQPPSRCSSRSASRPPSTGSVSSPRSLGISFNKLSVNSAVLQEALSVVQQSLSPHTLKNISHVSDILSESHCA